MISNKEPSCFKNKYASYSILGILLHLGRAYIKLLYSWKVRSGNKRKHNQIVNHQRKREKNKGLNHCNQNGISYLEIQYTQIPSHVQQSSAQHPFSIWSYFVAYFNYLLKQNIK